MTFGCPACRTRSFTVQGVRLTTAGEPLRSAPSAPARSAQERFRYDWKRPTRHFQERILLARGLVPSHESIREWGRRFGRMFANTLKRCRPRRATSGPWTTDSSASTGRHTSFAARSTSMGTSATVSCRANAAASTPIRRFVRHYMGRTRSRRVGRLRSNNFLSIYLPQSPSEIICCPDKAFGPSAGWMPSARRQDRFGSDTPSPWPGGGTG